MAWLTTESLWLSDKALERGILRSEVQFLTGNFPFPMLVENKGKKTSFSNSCLDFYWSEGDSRHTTTYGRLY